MKDFITLIIGVICLLQYSCHNSSPFLKDNLSSNNTSNNDIVNNEKIILLQKDTSKFEKYLISKKLIDLNSIDASIRVSLHYSTAQNF